MELLTYAAVAKRLACSKSHVRTLARAAEMAGMPENSVPPKLRRYLASGFPKPLLLGKSRRMARIPGDELEQWIRL